jgi:hypothetical protein
VETSTHPVLGQCTVLPVQRTVSAALIPFVFLASGIGGPIILLMWWFQPGNEIGPSRITPNLLAVGVLCTLLTPTVPSMIKTLSVTIPYFALISPVGFAALGREPILWKEVDDIGVGFYRGKPVRLVVLLTHSRKRGLNAAISAIFARVGLANPPNGVILPMGLAPVPIEELMDMFMEPWLASQTSASSQPV